MEILRNANGTVKTPVEGCLVTPYTEGRYLSVLYVLGRVLTITPRVLDETTVDAVYENLMRDDEGYRNYGFSQEHIDFVKGIDKEKTKSFLLENGKLNISIDMSRENTEYESGYIKFSDIPEDLDLDDVEEVEEFAESYSEGIGGGFWDANDIDHGIESSTKVSCHIDLYSVYPNRNEGKMVFETGANDPVVIHSSVRNDV